VYAFREHQVRPAAKVLGISVSTLFRFRRKFKMGRLDRTPLQDHAENFTDD